MKLTIPFIILSAISGTYSSAVERDTPIAQVLTDLSASINKVDAAANSFNGNIKPLLRAVDNVQYTINRGQVTANNCPNIEFGDAVTLLQPLKNLDQSVNTLFNDIKGRVRDVRKAGQCKTTRTKLSGINKSCRKLVQTTLNKVTSDFAKSIAQPYIDDIKSILAKYQTLFSTKNCPDHN